MKNTRIEKLREQRKTIDARIRQEQNKENAATRKTDTRRKILAGAWLLNEIELGQEFKDFVYKKLDGFLTKPDDRALFDLPVPPPAALENTSEPVTSVPVAKKETEPA